MAKVRRKQAKADVGLAHVEAALEMVAQVLEDVRLVVAEMRQRETGRVVVRLPPGLPCLPGKPGSPCRVKPGSPCRSKPGEPCRVKPGEPCRVKPGEPCHRRPAKRRARR
jgi:hypothetical protein